MAQKHGERNVWLNFGVSTRVHCVTIEYDPNLDQNQSFNSTEFTRGFFVQSQSNSKAGEFFRPTKVPVYPFQLPDVAISNNTVTFNFPNNIQETKALRITNMVLDFISIKAFFTDYEPSAIVRPKMSQPGKSSYF